jgi:hypothetical protein
VDDGDLLDEELHRDPRRPPPAHRSRSPARREDRRPAVHHPAAAHRHRRDHAGEGRMLTPTPRHLGLVIMGNNQLAFDAVCCHHRPRSARRRPHPPRPRARLRPTDLGEHQGHRRRHARGGAAPAPRLQGGPHPRREVLRGHATSRPTRARRPSPSAPTTAGAAAPARSRRRSRSSGSSTPSATPRCRASTSCSASLRGARSTRPGEKVVFIGDCAEWSGQLAGKLVQIRSRYQDRATLDPHHARHDDIFAKRRPPPRPPRPRPRPTCASRAARCRSPSRSWRWSRSAG